MCATCPQSKCDTRDLMDRGISGRGWASPELVDPAIVPDRALERPSRRWIPSRRVRAGGRWQEYGPGPFAAVRRTSRDTALNERIAAIADVVHVVEWTVRAATSEWGDVVVLDRSGVPGPILKSDGHIRVWRPPRGEDGS